MAVFGGILNTLALMMIFSFEDKYLLLGLILFRICHVLQWIPFTQMKLESFPTYIRNLGNGLADGIGRVATVFSPIFVMYIFTKDPYLPFFICGILSLAATFFILIHPSEKTQKELDPNN